MKEIGGYFELENYNFSQGIHSNAIKLNSGRNCLEYILRARNYTKIYIPYYTCDAILEPLHRLKIDYDFYFIDQEFEPVSFPEFKEREAILYTNYFGIKGNYINYLSQQINNLIIDNSQALFEEAVPGIDTFYSLRKFVGTPDGAFLYCNKSLYLDLPVAFSYERISHLYLRKDMNATSGYDSFKRSEASLSGLPIQRISPSTDSFITSYDFEKNKIKRERNFLFLHSKLGNLNKINIQTNTLRGPLCYPLLVADKALKQELINQQIFIPTFWPNVMAWLPECECLEKEYAQNLICLPVDQRYSLEDLLYVSNIISALL